MRNNNFTFTKVWVSETEYKIRRTGGDKPTRYLDEGNKQIPKILNGAEEKYIEIDYTEDDFDMPIMNKNTKAKTNIKSNKKIKNKKFTHRIIVALKSIFTHNKQMFKSKKAK